MEPNKPTFNLPPMSGQDFDADSIQYPFETKIRRFNGPASYAREQPTEYLLSIATLLLSAKNKTTNYWLDMVTTIAQWEVVVQDELVHRNVPLPTMETK